MMRRCLLFAAIPALVLAGCFEDPQTTSSPSATESSAGNPHAAPLSAHENIDSAPDGASGYSGGSIALGAITLTAPPDWQRKQASSSFVAAEFALPRAETDDSDARLTVSTAGGSVEANVDRWKAQFAPLTEEAPPETIDVDGLSVTIVDLSGNFNDARGPFAPPIFRTGYRMIAAIVPVGGQLHFVKATGPQQTMATHAEAIHEFIRSARLMQ